MQRIDEEIERQVIEFYRQEHSIRKIAEMLGICYKTVWTILVRNNEPRRSIGAPQQYPKTAFSGNLLEQARLLGLLEDCAASLHYRQIEVQTSTTHQAMRRLFTKVFGAYGHVSSTPNYASRLEYYQWHLSVDLNNSFRFVLKYKKNPLKFLRAHISEDDAVYIYIGSLIDAEGWVGIYDNNGHPWTILSATNNNRRLLELGQEKIGGKIGNTSLGHCHQLVLTRELAVKALRRIPITHGEKILTKKLILHSVDKGGIGLRTLREYRALRHRIDKETRLCTLQARLEWIRLHGKPHTKDPDQTIPKNYPSPLFLSS